MSLPPSRKRSADSAALESPDQPDRPEPLRLESVDKYPRKRVMTACNLCRFRKTKCDAVRPSCTFCTDLGVECHYRDTGASHIDKPEPPQRPREHVTVKDTVKSLESRVRLLENDVRELRADSPAPQRPRPDAFLAVVNGHTPAPTPPVPSYRDALSSAVASPRDSTLLRRTLPNVNTARPGLLTFSCPPYINAQSWNDRGDFFADEIRAGEQFLNIYDQYLQSNPDLSKRTLRRLQQNFVDHYLGWIPIIEQETVGSVVDTAFCSGFVTRDVNACLAMFILAIGASIQVVQEPEGPELPGVEYFIHGCQMLERFSLLIDNLEIIHCRLLQATYFKLAIRPIQAWNAITTAARDCRHVLSSTTSHLLQPALREKWHRTFWACSLLLDELEQSLRMHTEGNRAFHDIVPLPTFDNEHMGFYYFLAMISLRKMLADVLDVVGYQQPTVVYAPVVTAELQRQAQAWYDRLPPAVRFPLDDTPLFDPRKSYLRGQYFCMFVVLGWGSILRVSEEYARCGEGAAGDGGAGAGGGAVGETVDEKLAAAKSEARDCVRNCVIYLRCAEEQLVRWKMPAHNVIWASFALTSKLIICYRSPALAYIPETSEPHHIINALNMLQPFKHIPFVARGLARMSGMFKQATVLEGASAMR